MLANAGFENARGEREVEDDLEDEFGQEVGWDSDSDDARQSAPRGDRSERRLAFAVLAPARRRAVRRRDGVRRWWTRPRGPGSGPGPGPDRDPRMSAFPVESPPRRSDDGPGAGAGDVVAAGPRRRRRPSRRRRRSGRRPRSRRRRGGTGTTRRRGNVPWYNTVLLDELFDFRSHHKQSINLLCTSVTLRAMVVVLAIRPRPVGGSASVQVEQRDEFPLHLRLVARV